MRPLLCKNPYSNLYINKPFVFLFSLINFIYHDICFDTLCLFRMLNLTELDHPKKTRSVEIAVIESHVHSQIRNIFVKFVSRTMFLLVSKYFWQLFWLQWYWGWWDVVLGRFGLLSFKSTFVTTFLNLFFILYCFFPSNQTRWA